MYSLGIDSGSRMTKLCLYDLTLHRVMDYLMEESTYDSDTQIDLMIKKILKNHRIDSHLVKGIFCTGYGRKNYSKATMSSSEIICHARGVVAAMSDKQSASPPPCIKTVIDIGGQDSKIIKIAENGKVLDFLMNDKCAAGTGRFLEKVAQFFDIKLDEMSGLSEKSDKNIEISSTCVVFAESEIIGLVSNGEKRENIINAVHQSIIHRILAMSGSIGIEFPVAFVGGVAKNKGMVKAMKNLLENDVFVPEMPEFTGALGAALQCVKNG